MAENKTIEILAENMCCGCAACCNICPKNAIDMVPDREGFFVPVVDYKKCVNCGLCKKACPAMNVPRENVKEPMAYAVKSEDVIMKDSTSAGVFAQLANYIISVGGYVCGAAYNEAFEVHHILTNTKDGVNRIKKSKYVQSQINLIYRDIKRLLNENEIVLFSGTPCQVAGLHTYLGKKYANLYTMDIICHGTPAPMSWKKYLKENYNVEELLDIDFRHKGNHGFKKHHICFQFKNGKKKVIPSGKNSYYRHFTRDLGLRKSCSACEFAVFPRQGDITAGDFWGANKLYPELIDNDSGLSVVMPNNDHGKELFEKIKENFTLLKEISYKEAMTGNRKTVQRKNHRNREEFFNEMLTNKFTDSADHWCTKAYDIAIWGATMGSNYGGLITYYALYKAVQKLGYSPVLIQPQLPKNGVVQENHATRFCNEYMALSERKALSKYKEFNSLADTFLLGSDQIWNYTLFPGKKETVYLDFVDDSKKKIAYAASFGFEKPTIFPEYAYKFPLISKLMKKLDYVAVREEDGVDICKKYYDVPATHVMDPVFLLNEREYEELASKAKNKPEGKYMAVYCLTPGPGINEAFQFVSKKLNLPRVNMGSGNAKKFEKKKKNFDMPYCENLQMEEWIYNIKNSEFVVTDSYHCVCFSILFRKPFILIQKSWATSRIESLLSKLNLTTRWFESVEALKQYPEVLQQAIDYDAVYEILNKEIHMSMSWLRNAIKGEKVFAQAPLELPCQNVQDAYTILYRAKDLNEYWRSVKRNRDDLIVIINKKGCAEKYIDSVEFPQELNVGIRDKNAMSTGFAYICDTLNGYCKQSMEDFAHVIYYYNGIQFTSMSESAETANKDKISAMYIEKDGRRNMYDCQDDGLYILLYSKGADQVIDFVYTDLENDEKISVNRLLK